MDLSSVIPKNPSDVVFWTGAGISLDAPSNLPSGYSLTKEVVNTFCTFNTWHNLCKILRKARLEETSGNIKSIPRLEAILGNIVSILGCNILDCMSFLDAPPNHFHYFFSHHISTNGKHITLNLDLCIENAIKHFVPILDYEIITPNSIPHNISGSKNKGWLLHLHDKIGNNLSNLGLTIENVTKGINDDIKKLLFDLISDNRVMIFLGYSGSDVFDVNPFFYSLINHLDLTGKQIIWLDYCKNSKSTDFIKYKNSKFKTSILDSLLSCNAEVYVWHGITSEFIESLRSYWKFPNYYNPHLSTATNNLNVIIEEWKMKIVTAKVLVSMGLGMEALSMYKKIEQLRKKYTEYCKDKIDLKELTPENTISYMFNEAKREMGLYKDALKISNRIIISSNLDKMLHFERRASDYWLMGKLYRSKREYKKGLKYGESMLGNSNKFDLLYIECLRGYMQLCRDIGRLPVIGNFLMRKNIKYASDIISNNIAIAIILARSPYEKSHIARLLKWENPNLKSTAGIPPFLIDESNIVLVFSETDNILGVINTKRSETNKKLISGEEVTAKSLVKLLNLSQLIGDYPGVVKACHLIAASGRVKTEYVSVFLHALSKTQWIAIRKVYELTRYMYVCIRIAVQRKLNGLYPS